MEGIQDKKWKDSVEGLAPGLCTNNPFDSKLIILNCQSLFLKKTYSHILPLIITLIIILVPNHGSQTLF